MLLAARKALLYFPRKFFFLLSATKKQRLTTHIHGRLAVIHIGSVSACKSQNKNNVAK